jgi:hypothetical protein
MTCKGWWSLSKTVETTRISRLKVKRKGHS